MSQENAVTNRTGEVEMDVAVVLGRTSVSLEFLLNCVEGSLIEFDKRSGEPAEVEVNDVLFARGEVVTIAENFGVRLTELVSQ